MTTRTANPRRSGDATTETDLYQVLGLDGGCSQTEVHKAFARKAKQLDPYRNQDSETQTAYRQVLHAYMVLRDAKAREGYNRERELLSHSPIETTAPAQVPAISGEPGGGSREHWEDEFGVDYETQSPKTNAGKPRKRRK